MSYKEFYRILTELLYEESEKEILPYEIDSEENIVEKNFGNITYLELEDEKIDLSGASKSETVDSNKSFEIGGCAWFTLQILGN